MSIGEKISIHILAQLIYLIDWFYFINQDIKLSCLILCVIIS